MSVQLIERIVEIIDSGQESRAGLARAAGLHANSLRKLGEADWNPTADTLGKLERYLSRDPAGVMATRGRDHRRGAQRPHVHSGR